MIENVQSYFGLTRAPFGRQIAPGALQAVVDWLVKASVPEAPE